MIETLLRLRIFQTQSAFCLLVFKRSMTLKLKFFEATRDVSEVQNSLSRGAKNDMTLHVPAT